MYKTLCVCVYVWICDFCLISKHNFFWQSSNENFGAIRSITSFEINCTLQLCTRYFLFLLLIPNWQRHNTASFSTLAIENTWINNKNLLYKLSYLANCAIYLTYNSFKRLHSIHLLICVLFHVHLEYQRI